MSNTDDHLSERVEDEADEDLDAIRCGLKQSLQGLGRPAAEFFEEFEAKNNVSLD